jgi:5-hydroxyisourate hydrolase
VAKLSTHVLDTSRGTAAHKLIIDLHILKNGERRHLKTAATNEDGRTDEALLFGERIEPGIYELTFHAGDYFRRAGVELTEPPFLDEVVVRFGLADPAGHYHVPLLLAPYSYSTYRGS